MEIPRIQHRFRQCSQYSGEGDQDEMVLIISACIRFEFQGGEMEMVTICSILSFLAGYAVALWVLWDMKRK